MLIAERLRDERLPRQQRTARLGVLLAILLATSPAYTRAQDDTPAAPRQEPPAGSSTSSGSAQEPVPDEQTTSTLDPGTGSMADQNNRIIALRWGHLSALSIDGFYAHDTNYRNSPTNAQPADAVAARIVASYLVGNEREGLDLEYRPDVLVSQRAQDYQFGASLVNLHVLRPIGESWVLAIRDSFKYEPDFALFGAPTITLNSTGGITQQSLLPSGTSDLLNAASVSLSYRLARHDHIGFHVQDEYAELNNRTGSVKLPGIFYGSNNFVGGGVYWTHSIGPNHEFGVAYNYDRQIFGVSQSQYHNIVFNYRQKLRPTILLEASGGPSFHVYPNGIPNQKTFVASVNISKKFHHSNLAFLYGRGYEFTGVITDSYHDRYDAFYTRVFQEVWGFELGASYAKTHVTEFTTQGVSILEGFARLSYHLSPHWTLFASFTNSVFTRKTEQNVDRNFITAGARWSYGSRRGVQQ